ncbi:MAG TPA: flagellar basal-body MS-ring/collar protein FliF [Nitrospirota bacterium]|nr:flagellar basal-body MS-ring/collar protein FliF [Nitrospirota bacterium]
MADLSEQIRALPMRKLITLLFVAALVITAGILLITWLQKADQQLLYANLSEEDAGAIIQKLNEQKIPYTTSGGGITVPADKVYEVRIQLASQGLPAGAGVGFELFDKTSFTMSDFVQKLNYRRALQGELSRTIRSLGAVEQCRVHLVVPEKSLFMQKEEKPKASVLLKLHAGRRLSQNQVQGIVHLVASSVEGLDPNDVSVVNSSGEMLTAAVDENLAATTSQMDYQRNYERDMENKVITMLEPVVGKSKVKARVAASFDFTKSEKTEEKYDPDSQVARSEQRSQEKSTGAVSGGVPGTSSNLPGKQQQPEVRTGTPSVAEKKNETVNFEISKTVSHIISPVGEIKKLSAVVLVDGVMTAAQGAADKKYTPRSEDDLRQFEDMVKKAVGFSAARGDEVKVVNMPFEIAPQEETGAAEKASSSFMPMVFLALKYIIPLIALIMLFLFVIKPLMSAVTAPLPMTRQPAGMPAALPPSAAADMQRQLAPPEQSPRDQLIDWAKKNPKDAANLVKGWLDEK